MANVVNEPLEQRLRNMIINTNGSTLPNDPHLLAANQFVHPQHVRGRGQGRGSGRGHGRDRGASGRVATQPTVASQSTSHGSTGSAVVGHGPDLSPNSPQPSGVHRGLGEYRASGEQQGNQPSTSGRRVRGTPMHQPGGHPMNQGRQRASGQQHRPNLSTATQMPTSLQAQTGSTTNVTTTSSATSQQPVRILQRPAPPVSPATPGSPIGTTAPATSSFDGRGGSRGRARGGHRGNLYAPRPSPRPITFEEFQAQCEYLEKTASVEVPRVEMGDDERAIKEAFRLRLEMLFRQAIAGEPSGNLAGLSLQCFGSLASGFATQGSDVDLALVPYFKPAADGTPGTVIDRTVPRLLEKTLLDAGYGARLLTRTRVPILKVCESPTPKLYDALTAERKKWDETPEEKKYASLSPGPHNKEHNGSPGESTFPELGNARSPDAASKTPITSLKDSESRPQKIPIKSTASTSEKSNSNNHSSSVRSSNPPPTQPHESKEGTAAPSSTGKPSSTTHSEPRPWHREKQRGPLDFPASGIGIQCDVNFSTVLGLHNTALLRCYSHCDARVRPLVLFVKAWAARRKINSAYSGTLSSYGWALMVLHFLAHVAHPPVVPNLQTAWTAHPSPSDPALAVAAVEGHDVRFWRDEPAIRRMVADGHGSRNREPLGALLRNFFAYYAVADGFHWGRDVLSLRTPGGLRTKAAKGWTGARTMTADDGTEVRQRYLLAIEDPFELDHNVARTVAHRGIVAIRDEFRRAWGILCAVGRSQQPEGSLFDALVEAEPDPRRTAPSTNESTGTDGAGADGAGAGGAANRDVVAT